MCNTSFKIRDWTVCVASNSLTRDNGRELMLPPKLLDLLEYLAKNSKTVITREELVENVWNRSFVTDQAITQSIFLLRKALRDGRSNAESPEYIQTIPKRGYRLVDDVVWEAKEKTEEVVAVEADAKVAENEMEEAVVVLDGVGAKTVAEQLGNPPTIAVSESSKTVKAHRESSNFTNFLKDFFANTGADFKKTAY